MLLTLPHCKLPVCFPLFSSWWKEKKDYFDNKLEKYIFSGFCGNNYLTRYGKLNLSWACTAAWQASCWLPREFLRTVVLNPNCFHCSQGLSPTPAVCPLTDDLTSYFTAKTGHVGSLVPLFFELHDAWCFCLYHNAWVSKKATSLLFLPRLCPLLGHLIPSPLRSGEKLFHQLF